MTPTWSRPAGAAGATGAAGAPGAKGDTGEAGSAVGYAEVVGANVVAANSKNVTQANLTHPNQGIWCFSGVPFTPHTAQVTVESGAEIGFAFHPTAISSCANMQMIVVTTDQNEVAQNEDFMVAFN